ncbi:hypothetical protein [Natrarchaeobius halalkaliphilus]|uniref:hypothetical protein n=1 Tax=Natrarchaeobius halalkaliphilus TaxID=1679091 RepID=UPI000F546B8E|nr:hypothetical protein [Natrarchaeobius halalkaliphilus]
MGDDSINPAIIKARIVDNMAVAREYNTELIARETDISTEKAQEYLEELARENRIRKRENETGEKWVLFQ